MPRNGNRNLQPEKTVMSINTSFHARLLAAAFLLSGLCCNTALAQPYDPVTMDPVVLDPAFPAQLAPLTIMSSGSTMNGRGAIRNAISA